MKKLGYRLLKRYIKAALYLYYGKIEVHGLKNVPEEGPVLFLPNHQNALLDVLLIVVDCKRKPFFLTRSDVFTRPVLKRFFSFLLMIPIYRIRDGRKSLVKNEVIFDQCATLFKDGHAIVMFPEANHNLKRRVRNLSKGFTRILFNAIEKEGTQDIKIVPVGLNYRKAQVFPDEVSLYYGEPILVNDLYTVDDKPTSTVVVKEAVSNQLKWLTTHIEEEDRYDEIHTHLERAGIDFLDPQVANDAQKSLDGLNLNTKENKTAIGPLKLLFTVVNFPVIALWRFWAKPKVWEIEFMSTLRFAFAMISYPVYYLLLLLAVALLFNFTVSLITIVLLFVFNWAYVRLGNT
ncbi:1-acyl-sn-glycerol-3-phosphate acyltransferase [Flavobacteriaceae bacterium MAR_2009_75]|nr:1-acyl-sn-glycerol-3-phosphate acyltransferase [Flavobacteriaceae bacterium MAR_2009_75]